LKICGFASRDRYKMQQKLLKEDLLLPGKNIARDLDD
jgi:hypothetical protein